jgi:hypothetical protein
MREVLSDRLVSPYLDREYNRANHFGDVSKPAPLSEPGRNAVWFLKFMCHWNKTSLLQIQTDCVENNSQPVGMLFGLKAL